MQFRDPITAYSVLLCGGKDMCGLLWHVACNTGPIIHYMVPRT